MELLLRGIEPADLEVIFEDQRDPLARRMAAFGAQDPDDRAAFDEKWRGILADASIWTRSIEGDGELLGYLVSFEKEGVREVGYWIGRAHWGRGVATRALRLFLAEIDVRPLHACAVTDNAASIRVLEKCGFSLVRHQRAFARGRGEEVDEVVMVLARRES